MSQFSGKCDFWDSVEIDGKEQMLLAKVYMNGHQLSIENELDLLKYAPYLVSVSCKNGDDYVVYLTDKPYIDEIEQRTIKMDESLVLRKYEQCKQKQEQFIPENICESDSIFYNDGVIVEIAKRINSNPKDYDLSDLHTKCGMYYRRIWFEELVEKGMDEDDAKKWVGLE